MMSIWHLMSANHAPDIDKQLTSVTSVSPHSNSLCRQAKGGRRA